MAANQVDFKILPSDQFSVYSPQTRSDKVITYFTLLSKLRGDILSVGQDDDPNDIVSAFYSSVGGTQTLHLVKADGSEVTASVPEPTVGTVTSVDLTASTGISVSGGPITTSGSITVTNTAPDQVVVLTGAGTTSISGTYPSFTITSNDQFVGTVTSVGLTMPAAFSVANSPVTASGTLAVTAAGLSSQYIRGDGQLANFPTPGGGGSSVNYYLNGSVSQGTFGGDTYYELSKTPIAGAGTNFTRAHGSGDGYIASFITDANDPDQINIPGGNFNLEFYFNSSSSGGSPAFYGELYKVSVSNVFTLIASGSANPESITGGTSVDQYYTSIAVPQTALLSTDRLAIRVYVIVSGRNITLHTENSNFSEVITTFSTGLNSLNGLSDQVQYFAVGTSGTDFAISSSVDTHTFNLPTASATNRGALSSADWTTFNSKEPALTKGNLTEATSAVLTITGGTGAVIGTGTTIQVAQSGVSTSGFLSSTDWNTFNGKQNALTLTTTGSTGAATLIGATLNIPNYADQFVGTVTSVNMSVPTGFAISGNPITTSGTLAVAFDTGYSLPTNASQTTWNTAYNDSITAFAYNTSTAVLTLTQQDAGTLTATVTLQPFSTSNLAEGTNLYYTDTRARLALSAGTGITYDSATGIITNNDRGSSQNIFKNIAVAGQSTIVADANDDTLTVVAGSGVTITTNDTTDTLTISATGSGGTVTSVDLTAGTGISVSGGPITGSGSITVNNTAPDQTVVLTGGTGITTSGTYPSFTVTNSAPDQTVVLTAGTGITTSGTYPSFTVTNSAPDQTVALTAGTGISISGTYPSFTITNTSAGGGTITGSGTTNYVPKWTSASAIGDSAIYDGGGYGGFNSTGLGVRTFVINAANTRPLVLELVEYANVHSVYVRPNNSGFNLISSNYLSGGVYLPLALSGRENNTDLVVTTSGNVEIGNSVVSNSYKLDVNGTGRFSGDLLTSTSGTSISNTVQFASGNVTGQIRGQFVLQNPASTSVNTNDAYIWRIAAVGGVGNAGSYNSNLSFLRTTRAGVTDESVLSLNGYTGNVGIGTTGPTSKFQVNNNAGTGSAFYVDAGNPVGTTTLFEHTGANTPVAFAITKSGYSGSSVDFGILYIDMAHNVVGGGSNMHFTLRNSSGNQVEYGGLGASIITNTATSEAGRLNFYTTNAGATRNIRMVVNPDGNVGINTTNPTSKLYIEGGSANWNETTPGLSVGTIHLDPGVTTNDFGNAITFGASDYSNGDNAQAGIYVRSDGAYGTKMYFATTDAYVTGSQTRMYISEGGNVGIGTTAPGAKLEVTAGNTTAISIRSGNSGQYSILSIGRTSSDIIMASAAGPHQFWNGSVAGDGWIGVTNGTLSLGNDTTGVANLTIKAGNVGINNTSPSYKLDVTGDARINTGALGVNIAPSATDGRIDASNDIVAFSSSDLRLKENIKPIENALEKVKSLTGVEFDWKPELKHAHGYEGHDTGVIAQEVQEVMPTAIRTNDTGYLAVRYEKLIGLLIEGMKEQQLQIDELKSKLK